MAKRKDVPSAAPAHSPRRTRSFTSKQAKEGSATVTVAVPKKKKAAVPAASTKKAASPPVSKKKKVTFDTVEETDALAAEDGSSEMVKEVIIEACKQCQSFQRTALRVKDGLKKQGSHINVNINPEKPRRGCFEVRGANGDIFVSLLDMKRPFKPMKELNVDDLVIDMVEKLR